MKKSFNVTGLCIPEKHYMVDLTERVSQIKEMIDEGAYFTINCARQYGKTTTLAALAKFLGKKYLVISLDFQALGSASFRNENVFSLAFLRIFMRELERNQIGKQEKGRKLVTDMQEILKQKDEKFDLVDLFDYLLSVCSYSEKPIVLMIDEIDTASNNQVFLDFLSQLRSYYLERDMKGTRTFQSVILAGVYDIKNLKQKLRSDEEHKMNSPWNTHEGNEENVSLLTFDDCPWDHMEHAPYDIAADFDVDMSLSFYGIKKMLKEYETDYHTGMDLEEIAALLYDYTAGYPYLVSKLCKLLDEKVSSLNGLENPWTRKGFLAAVRLLLTENNTLFESLTGKLADYPELDKMLAELLFSGKEISYSPTSSSINLALMFGFVKNVDGKIIPANRIFDTLLYNHFLAIDEMLVLGLYKASLQDKNQFIRNGHLNMRRILEKFVEHFHDLYGNQKEDFLEDEGRRYFLLYLRPIINGTGNYYIESQTRSLGRTDVIVDYLGEQFIIEMKIWHGKEYNSRGEKQLTGYMDDYGVKIGYMVSFNFNQNKKIGVQEIMVNGKTLIEAVV